MLYRLEIENFYSIRDRQVIDLRAAANAPAMTDRLAPIWKGARERAPKVVALFGPNAAGKSNVLKALPFLAWFTKDSFTAPASSRLPFQRFNDERMLEAPTRLAIQLAGIEDITRAGDPEALECRYAYEVVIGEASAGDTVISEALWYWPSWASRKVQLFRRDADGRGVAARHFGLAGFHQALEKVLRPNASVISTLTQLKHPFSTLLSEAASTVVGNIQMEKYDIPDEQIVQHYAQNQMLVDAINQEIARIDVGISSMQLDMGSRGPVAFFTHEGLSRPMPMLFESHGARQFVKLYPFSPYALNHGGRALIDELDYAIHPILLYEIFRWFYESSRNPNDAQIWMSFMVQLRGPFRPATLHGRRWSTSYTVQLDRTCCRVLLYTYTYGNRPHPESRSAQPDPDPAPTHGAAQARHRWRRGPARPGAAEYPRARRRARHQSEHRCPRHRGSQADRVRGGQAGQGHVRRAVAAGAPCSPPARTVLATCDDPGGGADVAQLP